MTLIPPLDRYAVLGHPIHHSLSPVIHTAFATQTDQHLSYEALDVTPEQLVATLERLPKEGYRGVNITVPHKEAAWSYAQQLGTLSDRAALAGAINTIAWTADGVLGDNTDGQGLLNDLQQRHGLNLSNQRILLLGAGGATRGVVLPLLAAQPQALVIANRTVAKAETLAQRFLGNVGRTQLGVCGLDRLNSEISHNGPFDLVINATSASLGGAAIDLPPGTLRLNGFAYDMMYGKAPTPFLAAQKAAGVQRLADGLGMLVEQAAVAFALWRSVTPQTQPVYQALRERFGRR
jgi:shikimate dehydrogenase